MGLDHAFEVEVKEELEISSPRHFKVLLLNDDYSTMEFVIEVLVAVFHKGIEEAMSIMLKVHREGRGICGIYPYEIAEMKVEQVRRRAKEAGYPLRAVIEESE